MLELRDGEPEGKAELPERLGRGVKARLGAVVLAAPSGEDGLEASGLGAEERWRLAGA